MSRGTRHTPLRLSDELLARIDAEVMQNNLVRPDEPYTRSSWIRMAIEERIAKLDRGRKGRRARRAAEGDQAGGPVEGDQVGGPVEGDQVAAELPAAGVSGECRGEAGEG